MTQVKARLKTLKLCLERRIGKRIPPKHPITAWLVARCAALIRYRVRGVDGKTPYERVRMRPFNSRLVCFTETLKYKDRSKEERDDEHRWHHGIFLGICAMTGQYILCDELTKKGEACANHQAAAGSVEVGLNPHRGGQVDAI